MYIIDGAIKDDPARRWALPDRVFFACGACHILAFAFLERYPRAGFKPIWMKPRAGYTGNHVFVTNGATAFDYHGYCDEHMLIAHAQAKAGRWWPGTDDLPAQVIHGDLAPSNMLADPDTGEVTGLLDFELAGAGFGVQDILAALYNSTALSAPDWPRRTAAFLRGRSASGSRPRR